MTEGVCAAVQGLLPTSISYLTGEPGGTQLTMGALADSYYEYLLKVCACLLLLTLLLGYAPGDWDSRHSLAWICTVKASVAWRSHPFNPKLFIPAFHQSRPLSG